VNARRLQPLALLTALALALPALAAAPAASGTSQASVKASVDKAPIKPLTTLIAGIRGKGTDALALKQFDGEAQGQFLFGEDWAKGTEAQRKEFVQLFLGVLGKIAFPKVRENFKYLDSIQYEDPKVEGDRAAVNSTLLIRHPLKGNQTMKVKYTVKKGAAGWKVVDVISLGESTLTGLRDEQVRPLLAEGGWEAVLKALRSEAQRQGVAAK
jgi:phospholipid transport system substrate-binding protein